jgi:outer membrane protein OmpA-like peptidoglycan-associated protein
LSVERTELVNGRVDFIDRFIRPNYAADLTELNGYLGRFESGSPAMAPVELRGRAARTALLEIRGALNPTASPLMLDLSARATDLELAPLSPYGGKYVGYAIERGKLSVDLSYRIEADGRLEARNQIILNQLTFGERIESPSATSLPVRLALALLADRNGVIDVNLPISGSINDPQFSVMGLVFRMIGNLLVKVVTAPFAWLAGSDTRDLSQIAFDPGAARLQPPALQTLDRLFTALTDRPRLRMTITGAADHEAEAAALRAAGLAERLQALLGREAARAGQASQAAAPRPSLPPVGSPAYDALVRRLYADTPLPGKPRNALGMVKEVPVAEMEAALLATVPVNETTARELALQRALTVRDALIARGLAAERLFLAAPQVGRPAEGESQPQVRMTITGP